jgi:hypothetical protein
VEFSDAIRSTTGPVATRSAAARLQRLWVRVQPDAWIFVVGAVCCQVEVSATD